MNPTRVMMVFCGGLALGALLPPDAAAQRGGGSPRVVPRARPVVVSRGYYRPYYRGYYQPYFSPYYYGGFGAGFGLGLYSRFYSDWYAPYYAGYPSFAQYPYPYRSYSGNWSSARVEVKPREAQVYLDGYFVGIVDQFDGVFQRLDLPTGEHELTVYLKGYQPYRQRTLFRPGESYNFRAVLEPLPAGAADEPPPQARAADPYDANRDPRDPYARPPYGRDPGDRQDPDRQPPPPGDRGRTMPMPDRAGDRRGPDSAGFGTLNIRVQPGDASVVIDGERWDSPEGGSRLSLQLASGSHRIEVRKDGFKPYSATIQVRTGETQALNISLPQAQE